MSKKREAKTIQVFLRVRPSNDSEKAEKVNTNVISVENHETVVRLQGHPASYTFNKIFGPNSRQEDVFENVAKRAVEDAFEGYHGLLFVYGQTGTGKTWTMSNKSPGQEGMLQRCLHLVFDKITADQSGDYDVGVTFIQIYQEVIQDLLVGKINKDEKHGLKIRDDPDVEGGVYLTPVKHVQCYSAGQTTQQGYKTCLQKFEEGDSNRTVASTDMNDRSSRSHTVFTLYIDRRNKMTEADYEAESAKQEFKGRLILVDLAGCERQKKSGATGEVLTQANAINSSLLVLGKCIKALTDPRQFVPYRESKLTRLLQYSLAGHGKTTIIITAGPSEKNLDETRSAIEFGQRAMTIKQEAKKHVEIDYKALCKKLQAQLDAREDTTNQQLIEEVKAEYEEELEKKNDRIQVLEAELALYTGSPVPASPEADGIGRSGYTGSKGERSASSRSGADDGGGRARSFSGKEKFMKQMEKLEEQLDSKIHDMTKMKKEKLALQKKNNELEDRLQQQRNQITLLGMRTKAIIEDKDYMLQRMQTALLKVKRGDYVSPEETIELSEESDAPRPDGMPDTEYIQKLHFAIRKMREREAMLATYHQKAKEAIVYQAEKADHLKGKLEKVEDKLHRYKHKHEK